jgi:hypothetical protein
MYGQQKPKKAKTQTGTFSEKKRHGNFMNGVTKLNAGKAETKTERKNKPAMDTDETRNGFHGKKNGHGNR